ncbi:hypothetical protein BB560_002528 [Smittium megazygosporum]|uniref:Cwf15/Cwc15 cell cycle control protein n=1 Tax=Smittium megazygosporum TaxID=133381 RepID=A0A2T9ZEH8_9FUNG|nr:hypothetical protein BB560_002528 [Smittium megazygosporum]
MTTAARPTFDTARGRDSTAPTLQISSQDLPSHTKLKYRKPGQGGEADHIDNIQLREQLMKDEKESLENAKKELFGAAYESMKAIEYPDVENSETNKIESEKQAFLRSLQTDDNLSESEASDAEDGTTDSSDDDSDDETALLMKELEKIKKERELERKRKEMEEKSAEMEANHDEIMSGNPLLDANADFSVKRRWDEDVVFKNQARDMLDRPQKRFVNDMLRSDFHKKFMKRYFQ